MLSIIQKKRWTKNNTGFSKPQKKEIDECIEKDKFRNLDKQKNNLLHLSVICNEIEYVKTALKIDGLLDEKNIFGFTPLDLASLLGRQEVLDLISSPRKRIFHVEKEGKNYQFDQKEFEKFFNIDFLSSLKFNNVAILNWVVKKCQRSLKKKEMTRQMMWYGSYYAEEIETGYNADVTITFINKLMGFGLVANKKIKKKAFIAEYIGEIRRYNHSKDQKNAYCFEYMIADKYDTDFVIDARDQGNIARFVNHHDDGNITPIAVYHQGIMRVVLQANRDIPKGEQLCYDYGPDYWAKRESPEEI